MPQRRMTSEALAEANRGRNRTAQVGRRDECELRRHLRSEPAVSGSLAPVLDRQNPAEWRDFMGLRLGASAKSLQQQTQWRSK
jgi:hypothetical protein